LQTYRDLAGKGKSEVPFAEVAVPLAANYCGTDSATVLALHQFFAPMLTEMELEPLLREIEMPLLEVLVDMEWEGIAIDRALFRKLSDELGGDLRRLEQEITRAAGTDLNFNSPRQLASILFEKHQLPVLKKTKTGPSTDADVLEQLAAMGHELPRLILEYRELQKLKSTYVDTLPTRVNRHTGRIHTSFNQTGAASGRLSSVEPNLQNIPIRSARGEAIRRGFVPRAGWQFLVADYSQIELRLMAHLSGDPGLIEAFARLEKKPKAFISASAIGNPPVASPDATDSRISMRRASARASRSKRRSNSRMASAPIPATKLPCPYSPRSSR
jgi:DNA polymerase-1